MGALTGVEPSGPAQRARARLGLGLLLGAGAVLGSAVVTLPLLGSVGFAVSGVLGALPTLLLFRGALGARRALALGAVAGALLAAAFALVAAGACVATGCVG